MRPTKPKNTHILPKINQKTAQPFQNNIKPKLQPHRTPKINAERIQLPNNPLKIRSFPPKSITSKNKNPIIFNKNVQAFKAPKKNSEVSIKLQEERKLESKNSSTTTCSDEKSFEKVVHYFPKISWEDFKGQPLENSWFLAVIYWYVNYDIIVKEISPKFKVEVCAKCFMNKNKSWVKHHEYEELLEHEQGHYNIGCLCALMFEKRVKKTQFLKETYKEEIKKIFSDTMREYCEMEKLYDHETYHMLNEEKQREWNQNLLNQLQNIYSC